jgi:hypothetical protein
MFGPQPISDDDERHMKIAQDQYNYWSTHDTQSGLCKDCGNIKQCRKEAIAKGGGFWIGPTDTRFSCSSFSHKSGKWLVHFDLYKGMGILV